MKTIRITILSIIFIIGTLSVSQGSTISQPVPDTGITKCYNDTEEIPCPQEGEDFYGQDGSYSINPMSYTKLDDNGNDLPITATSWAMVRDNVTGLIWENKNSGDGTADYTNPHDADNTYTWYDSNPDTNGGNAGTAGNGTDTEDFIKALNDADFGGHSDWRLPNIKELSSIVDFSFSQSEPNINMNYFVNTMPLFYWSSYTFVDNSRAWALTFYGGAINAPYKLTNYYVRAVRGGQSESVNNNLVINGDGTLTDSATGLMWDMATTGTMTWKDGLAYCEELDLAGHTDWRMPTIKELRTIVDYSSYQPAIYSVFPYTFLGAYCSSSTYPNDSLVWIIDFTDGYDGINYIKNNSYYVRAVRNVTSNDTPTPTVTTNPATSITSTSATLNGTYDSGEGTQNLSKFSAMYFEYGTTTDYGATVNIMSLDAGTVVGFSSNITNLTPNSTYHFRLVMTDASTTYYGDDQTFTTTQDFGSLKVSISPEEAVTAGAAWRIDGGDWHDSDETVFNIAVGNYTVSFKDITGWTTPSNLPVTIQNEKTSTLTAVYTVVEKVSVLTPSSPNATVTAGEPAKLFGSSAASSITIEAGAVAKLINFPGSNTITIKGDSTNFKVSRSGAMVKFEGVDGTAAQGTVVRLPATKTEQTIIFNDVSAKLVIENNKVMFGTQSVTLSAEDITGGSANQQETITNTLGMTFNLIPAGTFTMGSPDSEAGRWSGEGPQHQVTLSKSYYMQTTEVTQGQWKAVMGTNPSYFQNCGDNCPVEQVSWNDIQTFITNLNAIGQGTYALPTEAQWEYAARAGSTTAFANGGITELSCGYDANLDKMGWYCGNNSVYGTKQVAQKSPNAWGLYDMHGNVWEWCNDWYDSYASNAITDPNGPSSGSTRVFRGGSWNDYARVCRSARRTDGYPVNRGYDIGFRP